jgi:exopolysaccharide production protein ExoY
LAAPSFQLVHRSTEKVPPKSVPALLTFAERAAALAGAVTISPFMAGVLAAVRLLSGRTPLIAHKRAGLNGETFWMLKVRTMWDKSTPAARAPWIERLDDPPVPLDKREPDPRVSSRFARLLRRYSIDEIPQLLHVVSGRMSLVGPRPMTVDELDDYYGPGASAEVLSVKPGLTGLWQIKGRNRLSYHQRRRLDLFLVRKASTGLYVRILLQTLPRVLSGRDAS